MKVAKFGGAALGGPEAIGKLVAIVRGAGPRVLVVSALAGVREELAATGRTAAAADARWTARFEALRDRHFAAADALLSPRGAAAARASLDPLLRELEELLYGVKLLRELSARTLDLVMSFGERFSAILVAAALGDAGTAAEPVDAREIIVATADFGSARPLAAPTFEAVSRRLRPYLSDPAGAPMPVIPGFVASTERGETVTLGRGGSDFTAAVVGAAVGAEEVEIWTDVDGIMSSDPGKVEDAFSLECLSYREAMELSHFGARIIYPPTVQPAIEKGIPIRVLNALDPAFPGTVIRADAPPSRYPVRGIASIPSVTLLRVQGTGMVGVTGIAMRLFGCLARRRINIILISQASSEQSICLAIAPGDREPALAAVSEEFAAEIADGRIERPIPEGDKAIVAVVGERMKRTPGISGRVFYALGRNGVNVSAIAQGSSELNISAVVDAEDEAKALGAVHEAFFLAGTRSVNVLMIGHGLVGGTLLEQIRRHRTILAEDYSVRLNVVGIADSKRMLLCPSGIDLEDWRERLQSQGEATSLDAYLARARGMKLPNTVFADCTANPAIPALYPTAMRYAMAVVTPNKKGNAGPLPAYREIMATARATGSPYLYETTAGAGLPVISTLHDLQVSGDRIIRIDASLSGTISYVLSNYREGTTFAELVRQAKSLGYTEPDPRDDLCAADAARKALILARELGYELEFSDVVIEPLVPPSCMAAPSVEEFFVQLEREEDYFRSMRERAEAKGRGLVYASTIEDGRIRLGFRETSLGHPLHGLRDAENAIAFTTERYSSLPLVVRGPGAGGEVTAGGLFADIVRVAKSLV